MPRIGPNSGGGGGGGSGTFEAIPAGVYVLAMSALMRKQGRDSGKDYLKCKFVICVGRLKNQYFWDIVSCDTSKPGTITRWSLLCDSAGVAEDFELGDSEEGTHREGDDNVRRLFFNQPFIARVSTERSGKYINNRIERIMPRRQWTHEQTDLVFQYLAEQEGTRGEAEDYGEDPMADEASDAPVDEYEPPAPRAVTPPDTGDAVPDAPDDFDDIPF
jgi:hypothetical protein